MKTMKTERSGRCLGGLGLICALGGMVLLAPGCATVKMDQFEQEMDQVRQDIRDGETRVDGVDRRVDGVEGRLAALENELAQLRNDYLVTVDRLEAALRFNAPVHFAFDDATVQPEDREVLDRFAAAVQSHYEGAIITVEGFTDPAGSAAYNLRLGERRAHAVREYLIAAGLREDQLRVISYGQAESRQISPGARGPGQEGWENRRVSMVIDFEASSAPPRIASPGG
jgi:outer membrane protein OmpA-like peptidoglycan-associated protein